jgi:hypothetical protein
MKIVIQCAARKTPGAGSFRMPDGRALLFVANRDLARLGAGQAYARPDDLSDDGRSWRSRLVEYNTESNGNPLQLLPAYRLYGHDAYRELVDRFGSAQVFILSAGWGLIPATFLTPNYDITFTASAEPWKRRRQADVYNDFHIIRDDGEGTVFLGGQDYLPLFCSLAAPLKGEKTVFFNAAKTPELPRGFRAIKYQTRTRTNWHYECARSLIGGRIVL